MTDPGDRSLRVGDVTSQQVRPLRAGMTVRDAVDQLIASALPALPVVDDSDRYVGLFGERNFIGALFPGYVAELGSLRFVPRSIEKLIDMRRSCADDSVERYVNREQVDVRETFSDVEVAEIFLHHRVAVVPILDTRRHVTGVISRTDFVTTLAARWSERA